MTQQFYTTGTPASAVQQGMYFRLNQDMPLRSMVNGILNYVPPNYPFPYVQIGTSTSSNISAFLRYGEEVTTTVHIYCRNQEIEGGPQGSLQTQQIMNRINFLLAQKVFSIGMEWNNVGCYFDFSDVIQQPDGITYHGILRYNIQVYKA